MAADARRLTFDDTLFDTMGRVLDAPVVTQTVWRFAEPLDRDGLRRFHAGLASGPLQRCIVRTRVPAARDRWSPYDAVTPLRRDPVLGASALTEWIADHAATPLDPEQGPVWSLAYAPLDDGGSALSFVTLHVVADGSLKLLALEAAATEDRLPILPDGDPGGLLADLRDAGRQIGTAARALPDLVRGLRHPVPRSADAETRAPRSRPDDDRPWTPPVVVVDLPLAEWQHAAEAEGGSANALVLAVCAELAVALGRTEPGATISIASPVSTRTQGDLRSNASTGVSIPVTLDAAGRASLAEVRASARTAYAGLAARESQEDPLAAARALLPLLPAALVRRLAPGWKPPLALASNLGTLSAAVAAPTGVAATSVLNRSITPPMTRGAARRAGSCLSAWWGAANGTATLCVAGADPDASPDPAALRIQVERVLTRRGLHPTTW